MNSLTGIHRTEGARLVRFSVDVEEEEMATRTSISRAAKETKVFLPSSYKMEEKKLGCSSGWAREHLKMLGVDFYAKTRVDLNRILGARDTDWSPEIQARMFPLVYLR